VGIALVLIHNDVCNALMADLLFVNEKCLISTDLSHLYAFLLMLSVAQVTMNLLELHFSQLGLLF